MSCNNDQMQVEFHNKAAERYFVLCAAFEKATSTLNRNTNEGRFQQAKKQYAAEMDQELQDIAKEVLGKHQRENGSSEIDPMFHRFIQDYLHRFVQKANAL